MAVTPAKIVQSETAADTCIDNGDESGLFTNICENETLTFTTGRTTLKNVNDVVTNSCSDHQLSVAEIQKIHSLFDELSNKTVPISFIYNSQELIKLEKLLHWYKHLLAERSLTARLWIQYIEYVETLRYS